METLLSDYGRSFATRERGEEVVRKILCGAHPANVTVSLDGVRVSPSFLQSFLWRLATSLDTGEITLICSDEERALKAERVTNHLGLGDKVTVERGGVPA